MKKLKYKIIVDPVFKSETLFYNHRDVDRIVAHAKKKYNINLCIESFQGFQGTCVELRNKIDKTLLWFVWVADYKDWKTMVHEASHLVFRILDTRKVKYGSDNDETWCYLQEYYVTKFWHEMCK